MLPIVAKLGMAWINWYFTNQQTKASATDLFMKLIDLHKNDGNLSEVASESYQQQVDSLKQSQGGANGSAPNPQGTKT